MKKMMTLVALYVSELNLWVESFGLVDNAYLEALHALCSPYYQSAAKYGQEVLGLSLTDTQDLISALVKEVNYSDETRSILRACLEANRYYFF